MAAVAQQDFRFFRIVRIVTNDAVIIAGVTFYHVIFYKLPLLITEIVFGGVTRGARVQRAGVKLTVACGANDALRFVFRGNPGLILAFVAGSAFFRIHTLSERSNC